MGAQAVNRSIGSMKFGRSATDTLRRACPFGECHAAIADRATHEWAHVAYDTPSRDDRTVTESSHGAKRSRRRTREGLLDSPATPHQQQPQSDQDSHGDQRGTPLKWAQSPTFKWLNFTREKGNACPLPLHRPSTAPEPPDHHRRGRRHCRATRSGPTPGSACRSWSVSIVQLG